MSKKLSNFSKQHTQSNCEVAPQGTENQTKNDPRKTRVISNSQYLFRCKCGALEWLIVDDLDLLTNLKNALIKGEQK